MTHPVWMGLAAALALISTLCWFGPLMVLREIILMFFGSGKGASRYSLAALGAWALVLSVLNVLCYYGALICSHIASFRTTRELRLRFADHIGKIPLGENIRIGSSSLYDLMEMHIGRIQSFLSHEITEMIRGLVYPAALTVLLLTVDFRLGLSLAVGIAAAYIFHSMSMGKGGVKNEMELYLDALDRMNAASFSMVKGMHVLKLFGKKGHLLRVFERSVSDYTAMTIPYTRKWEKYMCWYEALMNHMYLFLLPAGIPMLLYSDRPQDTAAVLVFYLILSVHITSVLPAAGGLMHAVMEVIYDIDRIDEVLSIETQPDHKRAPMPERFDVEFSHVSFSYSSKDDPDERKNTFTTLKDVSFTARQGEVTALAGPSGGGKSTIASLLARFWDIREGAVRIGGTNLKDMSFETLMQCTAYVFQDDTLFHRTIADNIRMGRPDASREEIIAAARAAAVDDVIRNLENGYDTVYGEKGMRLSGGEIQRILIARAILKNAPILVLDEATAYCDVESADRIRTALDALMKDKTVILIAHRPESLCRADTIIYIENGTILERGTHPELLEKDGAYASMWKSGHDTQKGPV